MRERKTAILTYGDKTFELPVLVGSEGEVGIDITSLQKDTGLLTFDPGYANTGSCQSSITFVDGEKGILRYRGIPIEQLAERSSFIETAMANRDLRKAAILALPEVSRLSRPRKKVVSDGGSMGTPSARARCMAVVPSRRFPNVTACAGPCRRARPPASRLLRRARPNTSKQPGWPASGCGCRGGQSPPGWWRAKKTGRGGLPRPVAVGQITSP